MAIPGRAVEMSSFDGIRRMEREKIEEDVALKNRPPIAGKYFTRSGKGGQWKKDLSESTIDFCKQRIDFSSKLEPSLDRILQELRETPDL